MIKHKVIGEQSVMRFGLFGIESIKQNIQVICSTIAGTVPLDRGLGVSGDIADRPYPVAQALSVNELLAAIADFEPRAEVISIDFESNAEDAEQGRLLPVITFIEREVQ